MNIKVNDFYRRHHGCLFVENTLSKKPAKAIEKVETIVKNQADYNMSMKQDYSKNIVEMKLLGKSYGANEGYFVYQSRKLPVTSAVKTYTKTAQEMIEVQKEYNRIVNQKFKPHKPTLLERIVEFFTVDL